MASGFESFLDLAAPFSPLLSVAEPEEDSEEDEDFSLVDEDFSEEELSEEELPEEELSEEELSEEDFSAAAAVSRWRLRVP